MPYGLRTRDAQGVINLDSSDFLSRIVWFNVVLADTSDSEVISAIAGKTTVEFSFPLEGTFKAAHSISRAGTTITWTKQDYAGYSNSSDSLLVVILKD